MKANPNTLDWEPMTRIGRFATLAALADRYWREDVTDEAAVKEMMALGLSEEDAINRVMTWDAAPKRRTA